MDTTPAIYKSGAEGSTNRLYFAVVGRATQSEIADIEETLRAKGIEVLFITRSRNYLWVEGGR